MLNIDKLWEIDQHYLKLDDYESKLKIIRDNKDLYRLEKKYHEQEKNHASLIENNQEIKVNIKKLTRKLEDAQIKLSSVETNLYNGSINDVKQLEHLSKEKGYLTDIVHQLEDDIINYMAESEEMEKDINTIKEELIRIKADLLKGHEYSQKISLELGKWVLSEEREIEALKEDINTETIRKYMTLRRKKATGVAIIDNHVCSGCHMMIANTLIERIKLGKQIYNCENCGRILYIPIVLDDK